MSSTPVPAVSAPEPPVPQTLVCMNCGTPLAGEYCTACGQRHEPHVHTVGHFAGEAFESITHADSRLWRTLGYLLAKPGVLTREFFAGRRARYLPPFRLYLVISLVFFLVAGMPETIDAEVNTETSQDRIAGLNEAAAKLEAQSDTPGMAEAAAGLRQAAAREKARIDALRASGADEATIARESRDTVDAGFCEQFKQVKPDAGWNYAAMQGLCTKLGHITGRELMSSIVHNIPRAMFVFLPLLALVMKLLYWRPKRYYVEHLLLLVHNHAFVFLAFSIVALLLSIPGIRDFGGLIQAALWTYLFWYIFRAMRVFYGQSRFLTMTKYLTVGLAYLATSILVLALTVVYSTLTI